ANNYGPAPGSAEINFGRILADHLSGHRDELIISTKAGYGMWQGPYGDGGSRKYLFASLDQSLRRLKLDYVDIFYHHRPDPETDLEETVMALGDLVRSGKALYVGLSNYSRRDTERAAPLFEKHRVPYVISQPSYNMFNRGIEQDGLLDAQEKIEAGTLAYQVLSQGLLTDKYLKGIPKASRIEKSHCEWLNQSDLTQQRLDQLIKLNALANSREQSLSQMAIAWVLRDERVTSALMGASNPDQILQNVQALNHLAFSSEELDEIDQILGVKK
ncbi:MAG TPA: L-glyceraldehyde 3-phosphate reductase, partial [Clostridiales bacterium UBA8960]|nr:L-glyceraldehyde 3-phosphate reductase [Clostridiales bacterium UBA8960]